MVYKIFNLYIVFFLVCSLSIFRTSEQINLLTLSQVKAVVQDKREEYVLDNNLEGSPVDEINIVFSIALMCLEPEPSKRPTMAEVVKMLEQIRSDKVVKDT